jgi:GNAT superfamily N-acetyltransferase
MIELRRYRRHEVPALFAAQIASYQRIQWPSLRAQSNRLWEWNDANRDYMHFMLVDEEVVISHASVNWRDVTLASERYSVWGLSSVFTYPAFRKGGFATKTVSAATDFMREGSGDVAMLFTGDPLVKFYNAIGWEHTPAARIFYGDAQQPVQKTDNAIMMLFMSDRGRAAHEQFAREDVFVGAATW